MTSSNDPFKRIPKEYRTDLWNCGNDQLFDVLQNLNSWFKENNQPTLSIEELEDIDEGRWAVDLSVGRRHVGFLFDKFSVGVER